MKIRQPTSTPEVRRPQRCYPRPAHSYLLILSLALAGCISTPTGTTRLYKPTEKTSQENSVSLLTEDPFGPVTPGKTIGSADTFAIYLNDGYFKYLKDFAGVNEVIIIAEFTETNTGTEADTVTRILGPYVGLADKTYTPFLNKLIYGPKKLESDHLQIKLTVIEYDQGENENTAAFLDFIQSSSQTLALANPLTVAEQLFTREIAKSLLRLNKDDVVLEIDMDFTADSGTLHEHTHNGSYIPLDPGDYLLVNKENCAPANCYFYLSADEPHNPLAWLGDAVLLAPTAMRRAWTDAPNQEALTPISQEQLNSLKYKDHLPYKDGNKYTEKTWLRLSIVKGGDASRWEQRKLLNQAEKAILDLTRFSGSGLSARQNYKTVESVLQQARQQPLALLQPDGTDRYCVYHLQQPVIGSTSMTLYRQITGKMLEKTKTLSPTEQTPNNTCFLLAKGDIAEGRYKAIVTYVMEGQVQSQEINLAFPPTQASEKDQDESLERL